MLVFIIFHFLFHTVMIVKTDSALPYMVLTGVFMAFTLVLLVAILVIFVCLCIRHRKRVTGKECIIAKN